MLEERPHLMRNKVEVVKNWRATRAQSFLFLALNHLYQSETTEVHEIAWLPKRLLHWLEEGHFMRNVAGIVKIFRSTHRL